jgi:hypothetical protein
MELKKYITNLLRESLCEQILTQINCWRVGPLNLSPTSGGIWFAETKEGAENFAKDFRNSYEDAKEYIITLNNPKYFKNFLDDFFKAERKFYYERGELMNYLIKNGYDGMYIDTDTWYDAGEFSVTSKQYVIFNKNQAKLVK